MLVVLGKKGKKRKERFSASDEK
jgi:hypothetical protein